MNAATKPVDVLAQSRAELREFRAQLRDTHSLGVAIDRLLERDAAVAELIEAAKVQVATDRRYGLGGAAHHQLVAAITCIGGSSVPPVFASPSSLSRRPLQAGEGGAAFSGARS